jgi:hypothetical protein
LSNTKNYLKTTKQQQNKTKTKTCVIFFLLHKGLDISLFNYQRFNDTLLSKFGIIKVKQLHGLEW